MQVGPQREDQRQPQQLAALAGLPHVHQDVHLQRKKQNREEPRPRRAHARKAEHHGDGQHRALREIRLQPAHHVINRRGDQRHHGRRENHQPLQIHPPVELEQNQLEQPAIRLPRGRAAYPRERIGMRKAVVLQDPLARAQVPPDVWVGDRSGGAAQAYERRNRTE